MRIKAELVKKKENEDEVIENLFDGAVESSEQFKQLKFGDFVTLDDDKVYRVSGLIMSPAYTQHLIVRKHRKKVAS